MNKKIIVYGMGYVGLANALLLAQNNEVVGIELVKEKVEKLNNKISPIVDNEISNFLKNENLNIEFKQSDDDFVKTADFAVIATPTNFDDEKNFFDTSSVENVIDKLSKINPNITIVVKSTIPIGFMNKMQNLYPELNLLFSPEFLREGKALFDNLHPSRIIVSYNKQKQEEKIKADEFANLLLNGSVEKNAPVLIMGYGEAESVKLFSNTYLAMRVAYFNELDNFALKNNLDTKQIISGMCADPRIGNQYNNPSFGYGGYCFPKDTKQLYANYTKDFIDNELIGAIVKSNKVRKHFIAKDIISKTNQDDKIGIYRLIMKSGSDNCRASAIFDIINEIAKERTVVIYEPTISEFGTPNCILIDNLETFKNMAKLVVANRIDQNIEDINDKVYTRDIFNRD